MVGGVSSIAGLVSGVAGSRVFAWVVLAVVVSVATVVWGGTSVGLGGVGGVGGTAGE